MAEHPRVVAELGRPETPDETAARKAESSRVYRSSQNVRNLIAALLVTVLIVVVIVFAVPRGSAPEREPIDVTAVAASIENSLGRDIVAPVVPEGWLVNRAGLAGDDVRAWEVVLAPEAQRAFVNLEQGLDADDAWASRQLSGAAPTGTQTLDGVVWDEYVIDDPSRAGGISYALATAAGTDTILVYGSPDAEAVRVIASGVADQVRTLQEDAS